MFERSLRMLPPPTPSRDIYNNRASQHHHHHQRPRSEPVPHQYEEPERTGECMVILPESQSAFRAPNSSAPGKCDCTSFYSIPGSVACLCGHSMAHHRPAAEASPSSPSTNSPYLAPLASFAAAAAAAASHHHNPSLAPTSASALNASSGNVHHSHRNTLPTLVNENVSDAIAGMMARVSKLEQMLTSSMHAHQALAESHRNLQTAHSRLTAHCAGISQKLDLMVAKSGDAAREALEVEILQQRQHKMAGELERLGQAVETLDERTEELEFRSEDVEKWVDEEKKGGKRGDGHCGGCSCEREAKDMERHQHHQHHQHHHHQHQHQQHHQPQHASHHTHPLDGSSDTRRRYAHAVTADSSASSSPSTSPRETSLPSPAPSASSSGGKRKRSHSDATTTSPPSWALPSPASSPSIVAGVAIREGKRLLQSF